MFFLLCTTAKNHGFTDIPAPSHLSDLTASLPVLSGTSTRNAHSKRKETLLSLLDALHELSQDDSMRESSESMTDVYIRSRLSSARFGWDATEI